MSVHCKAQTNLQLQQKKIFQVFSAEGKVSSLKHIIVFRAGFAPISHKTSNYTALYELCPFCSRADYHDPAGTLWKGRCNGREVVLCPWWSSLQIITFGAVVVQVPTSDKALARPGPQFSLVSPCITGWAAGNPAGQFWSSLATPVPTACQVRSETSAAWLEFNLILHPFPRTVQSSAQSGLDSRHGHINVRKGTLCFSLLNKRRQRGAREGRGAWLRMLFYMTDQLPATSKQLGTTWPAASSLEIPYLRSWPLSSDDTSSMWIWSQSWEAYGKKYSGKCFDKIWKNGMKSYVKGNIKEIKASTVWHSLAC